MVTRACVSPILDTGCLPGIYRDRYVGRPGTGRILRLCHCGSGVVESSVAKPEAPPCAKILRRHFRSHGCGLALDFVGLNAVKMLFWSAVVNGVLAPPLVVLVVLLTSDKKVMGSRTNSRGAMVLGWICAAVMSAAALALLVT